MTLTLAPKLYSSVASLAPENEIGNAFNGQKAAEKQGKTDDVMKCVSSNQEQKPMY